METQPDLKDLERERKQLAKAGDAEGLERLAAQAGQLPSSDRRDRLVYAARQNAAYARRGGSTEGHRGLAIGATILTVLLAVGFALLAAFADWDTTYSDYSVYNDGEQDVQVWSCTDDTCSLRDEEGTAQPDEAVQPAFAEEGDMFLVSGENGDVLGCITLPSGSTYADEVRISVSEADDCPDGAPTSVG